MATYPITGSSTVVVGYTTQLANATPTGGTWSSSNTNIATVDETGLVVGVRIGSATITFQGIDGPVTKSMGVVSQAITNGLITEPVLDALKQRITWRSEGTHSESGRYFEDFHPLSTVEVLKAVQANAIIRPNELETFLENTKRSVILECLNAVYNAPQLIDNNKMAFFRSERIYLQTVVNSGQFVGLNVNLVQGDFATHVKELLLFFNKDCEFTMYLYDDMIVDPIYTKRVVAKAQEQTLVALHNDIIFRNLTQSSINGGRKYFGYYQDDIQAQGAQAMYYNLNYNRYSPCNVWAFSAPVVTDVHGNRNFNRYTIGANNLMYGLNAKISTYRDATNNIIENAHLFDELIGLQMAAKTIEFIVFSYRTNVTERNLQNIPEMATLYNELNLARPSEDLPFSVGLRKQIEREVVRVKQAFQPKLTRIVGF